MPKLQAIPPKKLLANIDTSNDFVQWRIQGRSPLPLFLGQTEARRAGKKILETAPPPLLSQGLDDPEE